MPKSRKEIREGQCRQQSFYKLARIRKRNFFLKFDNNFY